MEKLGTLLKPSTGEEWRWDGRRGKHTQNLCANVWLVYAFDNDDDDGDDDDDDD